MELLGIKNEQIIFYGLEDEEEAKQKYSRISASSLRYIENAIRTALNGKKIYPNDPCPCGSGKKYKKCCGRK